jgi:hypothetical protein
LHATAAPVEILAVLPNKHLCSVVYWTLANMTSRQVCCSTADICVLEPAGCSCNPPACHISGATCLAGTVQHVQGTILMSSSAG